METRIQFLCSNIWLVNISGSQAS